MAHLVSVTGHRCFHRELLTNPDMLIQRELSWLFLSIRSFQIWRHFCRESTASPCESLIDARCLSSFFRASRLCSSQLWMNVQACLAGCHIQNLPRIPSSVSRIASEGISNSVPQVGQRLFFLNANSHVHLGHR